MSHEGKVFIGKINYENGKMIIPKPSYDAVPYPYQTIIVMMRSHSKWWPLSPYCLKDDNGYILECIWQFSKAYEKVPKSIQRYSRYDDTIIWNHPEETHLINGNPTQKYWEWRQKGFENKYPVRYPVGFDYRKECKFFISDDDEKLDYVEARKKIYLKTYIELVSEEPLFLDLKNKLKKGINLLIAEVDGPHQESMEYYSEKYGISPDLIQENCIEATRENLELMMNDMKHSFGHGYSLAWALLDLPQ